MAPGLVDATGDYAWRNKGRVLWWNMLPSLALIGSAAGIGFVAAGKAGPDFYEAGGTTPCFAAGFIAEDEHTMIFASAIFTAVVAGLYLLGIGFIYKRVSHNGPKATDYDTKRAEYKKKCRARVGKTVYYNIVLGFIAMISTSVMIGIRWVDSINTRICTLPTCGTFDPTCVARRDELHDLLLAMWIVALVASVFHFVYIFLFYIWGKSIVKNGYPIADIKSESEQQRLTGEDAGEVEKMESSINMVSHYGSRVGSRPKHFFN